MAGWLRVFTWESTNGGYVMVPEASIYIDGTFMGKTDSNGTVTFQLEEATYEVVAKKIGYVDRGYTVTVYDDLVSELYLDMVRVPIDTGILYIWTVDENNVNIAGDIYVDNVYRGRGNVTLELPSGNYDITCKASGYADFHTTATVYKGDSTNVKCILRIAIPLKAFASAYPTSGNAPLTVGFQGSGSGGSGSYSYHWNFGDGTTSTQQNPPHTYTTPKTYTVILTVMDGTGTTATDSKTIKVIGENGDELKLIAVALIIGGGIYLLIKR